MQIKDMMTTKVETISPETPVRDVAQKMKAFDVGFFPVVENDHLVGTVTDRDIVVRAVATGQDVRHARTREVMTNEALTVYDDQSVDEAAAFMAEKGIRRVLIVDRSNRLVGIVSIGDLAQTGGEQRTAGETIKEITEAPSSAA